MLCRKLDGRRKKKRHLTGDEEDTPDGGEEDAVAPARLRIMAVRVMGYTHTEFGLREPWQITAEIVAAMKPKTDVDENDPIFAEGVQ